jgi:hypothetical protein
MGRVRTVRSSSRDGLRNGFDNGSGLDEGREPGAVTPRAPMRADMAPRASVIIPGRDRRDLLAETLDALDAQDCCCFEVIVVDDGSSDGSGELAASRTVHGKPVRVLDGGGHGAVRARTIGVEATTAEVLAFTDSDCLPDPRWLSSALAAIDAGADAVNGLTQPARPMLPLERSMGSGTEGLYPTCNMIYRRAAYEAAGGFDQSIADRWGWRIDRRTRGDGFGEDTMLAWRVIHNGGKMTYCPEALVHHAVLPFDPSDFVSRTLRVGGFPAMVREVPELRTTLFHHQWQLGARTRLPMYAAAATAIARRPVASAACTAVWAALRWRELRCYPTSRQRRLAALPVELASDVLTGGALLVGSLRARSIAI